MEQEVIKWEQKKILFSYKAAKMKIAICDENKALLKELKSMIYSYANKMRLDVVADCYLSGEEMLAAGVKYNIVFLGYGLEGRNGLEIAKSMRLSNDFTSIIFVSEYTDFVFEAIKVRPYRFLVPPLKEDEIYTVLDEFFKEYSNNYPLWIKCGEETVSLNVKDIFYLEANNKHCIVHLTNEELDCNKTMARVSGVLPKNRFTKINRAYIVNFECIKKYNNDAVFLKNGKQLHISRNYLKSFKQEYRLFLNPHQP